MLAMDTTAMGISQTPIRNQFFGQKIGMDGMYDISFCLQYLSLVFLPSGIAGYI